MAGGRPAAVLALVPLLAAVTACGAGPVSPLPTHASRPGAAPARLPAVTTAPSVTVAPRAAMTPAGPPVRPTTTTTVVQTTTVRPPTSSPTPTVPCRGVEQYDLDVPNTELALITSMCFRAGSLLRLQGIGPGLVTVEPDTVASDTYAGGVVDIRLLRPGAATVTIPKDDQVHTIDVVVIR